MKRKTNIETLWCHTITWDDTGNRDIYTVQQYPDDKYDRIYRVPKYPKDYNFRWYTDTEDSYFPILSTYLGWKKNRENLRRYHSLSGFGFTILCVPNNWPLLRKCFGKHFRNVMKELSKEFSLDDRRSYELLSWDSTKTPKP